MNTLHEGEGKEKDSAKETARPRGNPRGTRKPEPLLNQPEAAAESLRHRFLQADNQFYFRGPGDADRIAFADHGRRLTTEHEDPHVIHGMLLLAQAKGWTSLHVKGSDAFKAEAWMQATMAGIEVQGYQPREIDRVRREERRGETPNKQPQQQRVEPGASRDPSTGRRTHEPDSLTDSQNVAIRTLEVILRERGDSASMIAAVVEEATARLQGERLVVGTILEHGKARYGHDEKAEQSYVVKVATAKGEKEVWGVDLARAMERSGAKTGDAVALIQRAHERVTIQSPVKNEAGEVVGMARQPAKRNKWEILNLQTIGVEARDRLKSAALAATHEPVVQVFDRAAARTDHAPEAAPIRQQERTRAGR